MKAVGVLRFEGGRIARWTRWWCRGGTSSKVVVACRLVWVESWRTKLDAARTLISCFDLPWAVLAACCFRLMLRRRGGLRLRLVLAFTPGLSILPGRKKRTDRRNRLTRRLQYRSTCMFYYYCKDCFYLDLIAAPHCQGKHNHSEPSLHIVV